MDVEVAMTTEMARRALWLGPAVATLAGVVGGWDAAGAAIIGSAVVVLTFWTTGYALSWAARRSPAMLGAFVLGGFLVRLIFLTGFIWLGLAVLGLDQTGLFIGLGGTYVGLLVTQARRELVAR